MSKYDLIDLQQKAIKFRRDNGFSNAEPIRLKSLLLKCNVLTLFRPLSGNFSGMAVKVNNDRFMMVNCDHSIGKQHFTIAHELYHLFIQEEFLSRTCITGQFNKEDVEEFRADYFASFFLLPEEGMKINIPSNEYKKDKISLETVLKLEQYYSVSRRAILQRLKGLDLISNTSYNRYSLNVKHSAASFGYELDLYSPGNANVVIGDYGVRANNLYQQEKISESHYIELMRTIGFDPLEEQSAEDE